MQSLYDYLGYLLLGAVQGVAEWLPISSKTVVMLVSVYILGNPLSLSYSIGLSLQGGTVVSALTYFWRSLREILYNKRLVLFLIVSTIATGLVGLPLYIVSKRVLEEALGPGIPTVVLGTLLIIQALLYRRSRGQGHRSLGEVGVRDALVFGVVQGVAALPGVSRSGATIATLLYLGYSLEDSMRLSFLASILANSGATAAVYILERETVYTGGLPEILTVFLVSAIVGLATIRALLELARRYRERLTLVIGVLAVLLGVVFIIV